MKRIKKVITYNTVDVVSAEIDSFLNEKECKRLAYLVLDKLTHGQIAYGIDLTTEAVNITRKTRIINTQNYRLTISRDDNNFYFKVEEKTSGFVVLDVQFHNIETIMGMPRD